MLQNFSITFTLSLIICFPHTCQVALDEKEAILGSIPAESKEKGSLLYTTLIEGKVVHNFLAHYSQCY